MGYDPNSYAAIPEEDLEEYLNEHISGRESMLTAAGEHAGSGVGAAAAMMTAGGYLASTGVGFWPGLALMGGAGILGSVIGGGIQDKGEEVFLTDEQQAALDRKRQEAYMANPNYAFAGSMLPSTLAFRPSPTQLVKGVKGLGQAATGRLGWGKGLHKADVPTPFTTRSGLGWTRRVSAPTQSKLRFESPLGRVAPGESQALKEMALGATFDTAIEGGFQAYHGDFDPSRLAIAAGVGTALQRPTFKPPGLAKLVERGEKRAIAKGRDPNTMFNPWREPIPAYSTLKDQIGDVGYTSVFSRGKIYESDIGRKVGAIEDASTPTDTDLVAAIEAQVTRGTGFLDPAEPGPAARSMERPDIGAVPLTADEVAAAQKVSPERYREVYGASEAAKTTASLSRAEGVQELAVAKRKLAATRDEGVTYSAREKKQAQTAVNRAQKKIDKADKVLDADVSKGHERAILKLFSSAAKPAKITDPVTGKPRTVKAAEVPREASKNVVDSEGEPLIDRLGVWLTDPVRVLANGRVQKAVPHKDGSVGWQFVSKPEAAKIQKAFHDHAVGMRKKIGEARRELEKERRMATGKPVRKLKPLDPEVVDILNRLALVRGFNLAAALKHTSIGHPDGGLAGGFAAYDRRTVTVDPRRMSKDTIAHEGFHNWLDDLQYSSNPRDQKLRQDFLELFAEEERAVEFLGRAMTQKVETRNQHKFSKLVGELKTRWKDRFGFKLTDKQLKNYMLLKYEHDMPFLYNDDMVAGFAKHLYGTQDTAELKRGVLEDVRAGRPIRRDDAYYEKRAGDDPWKELEFQKEKRRYNSRGEEAATEKEVEEGFSMVKKSLGMPEDTPPPKGSGLGGMLNKVEQDTGQKFQAARGERKVGSWESKYTNPDDVPLAKFRLGGELVNPATEARIRGLADDTLYVEVPRQRRTDNKQFGTTGVSKSWETVAYFNDQASAEAYVKALQSRDIQGLKFQAARGGERTLSADEAALFASSRDRAKHMAETFDKFLTDVGAFDPERRILSPFEGKEYKMLVDPRWWFQKLQYSIAETDQLLVRPFKGLVNADITDATKKQALYIRDAHNRLEMVEKRYIGRFAEPLIMEMQTLGLNKADVLLLGEYRTLRRMVKGRERRDFADTPEFAKLKEKLDKLEPQIKDKLHAANESLDRFFSETRLEHAANGPLVWRKKRWVKVSDDPDHVDKNYDPYMLSRDASSILRKKSHTKEGKDLQEKIIKHWGEESTATENELRDMLSEYVAVISNKDSYTTVGGETKSLAGASKFQALRKAEGLSMPLDLVDPDPFIRAQRYAGRFAKDMAWYTQIESDNIVRAIRDLPDQMGTYTHRKVGEREATTPTLKEIFGDDVDVDYANRAQKTFNNLDEVHAGFHSDMDLFVMRANRMVTANWLGLYSGARDFVTAFEKASHYMRLQDYPLMLKAVTHFGDAWKQSHRAGANRNKFSSIEFAMDSADRVADSFSTVADFSQKWSGRELFEKGTRAIQFSLGKLLMRSYLNSSSKDPHVQRILTTMGRFADVDTIKLRKNPTEVTEGDLHKLATAWVEINQGTYGVRGVPSTMIRGKGSYVLSLSRWSVEKYNRYMKDVILPIIDKKTYGKRDFRPLIKATLGGAVTGVALNEVGKMMNAKESYEPSLEEVLESPSGAEDFIYHAMHLANLSGYFGILSALGNDAVRMYTGKSGAEDFSLVTFPALEALVFDKGFGMSTLAYMRSGNVWPLPGTDSSSALRYLEDIMTNLNQTLRIARNQALAHTEVAQTLDKALSTGTFRGRASEFEREKMNRDLKVFNRLYRGDHGSRFMANLDRYEKTPASAFRNSETVEQLQDTLKPFLESAWKRSQTKEGVDPNKFKRLLQQGYVKHKKLSPNVTDAYSLREARRFADFIARTKSEEAVRDIMLREYRDEGFSQVRKKLIQDSVQAFLATKGY